MEAVLFNNGMGNVEFANLPRKFNICISPTRDDFPHTQVPGTHSFPQGHNTARPLLGVTLLSPQLSPRGVVA